MLFGLPTILGLLPIVIYAFLGFKGVHPLLATVAGVLTATILSGQGIMGLAAGIYTGAGSFLGVIGLLVMFGTALAEILKDTGAAPLMVRRLMKAFPLSPTGIIIGSMVSIVILTVAIGSMIAAAAMVATVAITLAATYKVSPTAMAIAFHCGSVAGLLIGPFTPPTVQMMELFEFSYGEYALKVAGPMAILMFIIGIVMALWAQKKYGPSGENIMYAPEEAVDSTADDGETKTARFGAMGFVFSIIPLIVYGIVKRGGMNFALIMILAVAAITGLAAGYKPSKVSDVMMRGASRMAWFYLMFVLFDPFVNFVAATGAFTAVGDLLQPMINAGGNVGFLMIGSLFGIFGISGAAVAQAEIMNEMFSGVALTLGTSLPLYVTMLLVGSQITSFAYPGADMMTEFGLARSSHLKSLILNGWVVTIVMTIYMFVRSVLNL